MLEHIGLIGIILLNFSVLPQIIRIVRLKDSQDISILSILIALIGIGIMLIKAYAEKSSFFMLNYELCGALDLIFLYVTLRYRR